MRNPIAGQNIVVFDLETKKACGTPEVPWTAFDKMGISVGVSYSFLTREYRVFMDDNIPELAAQLHSADLVVGFNIDGFDVPLLSATLGDTKSELRTKLKTYDLLTASRRSVGWSDGMRFPSGLKLDDHLLGTFGREAMKTEAGADAPRMYDEKQFGRLISYCVADVKREAMLLEHVWNGYPVHTQGHGWRKLPSPQEALAKYGKGSAA